MPCTSEIEKLENKLEELMNKRDRFECDEYCYKDDELYSVNQSIEDARKVLEEGRAAVETTAEELEVAECGLTDARVAYGAVVDSYDIWGEPAIQKSLAALNDLELAHKRAVDALIAHREKIIDCETTLASLEHKALLRVELGGNADLVAVYKEAEEAAAAAEVARAEKLAADALVMKLVNEIISCEETWNSDYKKDPMTRGLYYTWQQFFKKVDAAEAVKNGIELQDMEIPGRPCYPGIRKGTVYPKVCSAHDAYAAAEQLERDAAEALEVAKKRVNTAEMDLFAEPF